MPHGPYKLLPVIPLSRHGRNMFMHLRNWRQNLILLSKSTCIVIMSTVRNWCQIGWKASLYISRCKTLTPKEFLCVLQIVLNGQKHEKEIPICSRVRFYVALMKDCLSPRQTDGKAVSMKLKQDCLTIFFSGATAWENRWFPWYWKGKKVSERS